MKFKGIPAVLLRKTALFTGCVLLLISSCKRTETLETLSLEELIPLQVGKYITYRLDSLVFTNSGKLTEVHRYQIKHTIDRQSVDNQNRPTWVVVTYINDSTGIGPWVRNGTYTITPVDKRLEVTENNLRVIKINLPSRVGFTWKGNAYLPDRPFNPEYPISIDANMSLWDFQFETVSASETVGSNQLNDVTTIFHIDESENVPLIGRRDTSFASREFSIEKYAKNIGLVYREFELWENQPRPKTSGNPPQISYDPVRIGFGIKMWMIDKN
ncbi:hypothetical protein [Lacibacter sp. H407]|uniref:hypothetical protein n=1 Tax=Lacibacter sp. H407 TaxID=3133423 RepID=UPI0030BB4CEC